jgi:O-antigen ligase
MDLSGQIRKAQWNETWGMLQDGRIFTGSGLANYKQAVAPYHAEGIFVRDPHDPDWHRKTVWNEEFRNSVWQPLEIYMYPHNIFLNFWVELGLAGMILFIWIVGKFLYIGLKNIFTYRLGRNLKSKNRYFVLGLVCAMMVIVVHGLVDVPYFKNDLAVLFWLLVAMIGVLNLENLEK